MLQESPFFSRTIMRHAKMKGEAERPRSSQQDEGLGPGPLTFIMAIRFGAHLSIAGGFSQVPERAVEESCQAFQIFSRNPRTLRLNSP